MIGRLFGKTSREDKVFHLLDKKGLGLEIKAEFDTTGCEFYVSLGKKGDAPMKLDRLAILKTRKLENA